MVEYKVLKGESSWYQVRKNGKEVFDRIPLKVAKGFARTIKQNDKGAKVEVIKTMLVGRVNL